MNQIYAGIDVGSRTIKFVLIENEKIIHWEVIDNNYNTLELCNNFFKKHKFNSIIATGYGRNLLEINNDIPTVSEIKAFATGINKLIEGDKVIIDIGGQDTKFIKIKNNRILKFEMNDRCAAGTGKFFEIMSKTLGYNLDEFSNIKYRDVKINITSMCAVFAESEVTSLLAKGENREEIAIALHKSIAKRVVAKLKKFNIENEKVIFCGGCAYNKLLKKSIEAEINKQILIPENPQIIGAYGAALCNL